MRFMMLMIPGVYQSGQTASLGESFAPDPEMMATMMKYNGELNRAGVLISLDGLHPQSKGARVAFRDGTPTVTDGPFVETKEVVGGYWLIQVASKEEAVDWAKRCPAQEGDVIEIRQLFELSDFPPEAQKLYDPDLHAQLAQ